MAKQFQISTRWTGRPRTFQVIIYDTAKELQQAAAEHSSRHDVGQPTIGWANTYGTVQSYFKYRIDDDGTEMALPGAGFIRLSRKHLRLGIISHEATHAALALYNQDVIVDAPGHESEVVVPDMMREELICYMVGDLTSRIVAKLKKLGYEYV